MTPNYTARQLISSTHPELKGLGQKQIYALLLMCAGYWASITNYYGSCSAPELTDGNDVEGISHSTIKGLHKRGLVRTSTWHPQVDVVVTEYRIAPQYIDMIQSHFR